MNSVNALEAIRFYVSFACTFAFAERKIMEGNSKILKLIARDENVHLSATQHIINLWHTCKDDPLMAEIAEECKEEARQIFLDAVEQEKEWADYLFKEGSMIGLNKQILCEYVDYIAYQRMSVIGLAKPEDKVTSNPLPWMNNYLASDNVQVAPQESEINVPIWLVKLILLYHLMILQIWKFNTCLNIKRKAYFYRLFFIYFYIF